MSDGELGSGNEQDYSVIRVVDHRHCFYCLNTVGKRSLHNAVSVHEFHEADDSYSIRNTAQITTCPWSLQMYGQQKCFQYS